MLRMQGIHVETDYEFSSNHPMRRLTYYAEVDVATDD